MKKILFLFVCISLFACKTKVERHRDLLIKTDKEFSEMSVKLGMKKAFLFFADEQAVKLKDNSYPIVGKAALNKDYGEHYDSTLFLTWTPSFVEVSESNDLGYTYGIFTLKRVKGDNEEVVGKGSYITIWKKQADGSWKWVLDTGTEGLGKAQVYR